MSKLYPYELTLLIDTYKLIDKLTDELNADDRYNNSLGKVWSILHEEIEQQTGQEDVDTYVYNLK